MSLNDRPEKHYISTNPACPICMMKGIVNSMSEMVCVGGSCKDGEAVLEFKCFRCDGTLTTILRGDF